MLLYYVLKESFICYFYSPIFDIPHLVFQPLFKSLSKLWCGLQDEAELLNILNNIMHNLQPFVASQANIFSEAYLDGLLEESEVKTDKQRMTESSGMAAVTVCQTLN